MLNIKKKNGFSLLELLVVILVILILATISVLAINSQKAKARDAKRISDIRQIQTALEFYKSDEGEYPIISEPIILGSQNVAKLCAKTNGAFVSAQTICKEESTYMLNIPADPLPFRNYTYTGNGSGYSISFTTERPSLLGQAGTYYAHSAITDKSAENK
jgi:general secretion pathway protein G